MAVDIADLVVIDDDEDLRILTSMAFRLQGWTVLTARDGEEGMSMLHDLVGSGAIPTVLLDVQMPGVDGWETLVLIRDDPLLASLPVLLCTVRANVDDRLRGYALGADGFVAKPFDIDDLVAQAAEVRSLTPEQRAARRIEPPRMS